MEEPDWDQHISISSEPHQTLLKHFIKQRHKGQIVFYNSQMRGVNFCTSVNILHAMNESRGSLKEQLSPLSARYHSVYQHEPL